MIVEPKLLHCYEMSSDVRIDPVTDTFDVGSIDIWVSVCARLPTMLCQAFGPASSSSFVASPASIVVFTHWKKTTILFWTAIRWPRRRLKEVFLFASIDSWFSLAACRRPLSICTARPDPISLSPSGRVCAQSGAIWTSDSWLLLPTTVMSSANGSERSSSRSRQNAAFIVSHRWCECFRITDCFYLFTFLLHAHSFFSYLFLLTFIPPKNRAAQSGIFQLNGTPAFLSNVEVLGVLPSSV